MSRTMNLDRGLSAIRDRSKASKDAQVTPVRPAARGPFTASPLDLNLLPPTVFEAGQVHRARKGVVVVAVLVVAGLAGLWTTQSSSIAAKVTELQAAKAVSAKLNAQSAALSSVQSYYDNVTSKKTAIQQAMNLEILYSTVLRDLRAAAPSGVTVATVALTTNQTGPGAQSNCPSPDPFQQTSMVTCMTFSGTASSRAAVSAFVQNLRAQGKFTNPYTPKTDAAGTGIAFSGSVGLTDAYHSHRYATDDFLLGKKSEATP